MAGFFGALRADPEKKENAKKAKELRKLVKAKRYAEALKTGTEYLKKVPENHDVQFIVGSIHYMQNRHRSAIAFFEQALEIGEYDTDVLLLNASSHYLIGQNRRAIECCKKIQEIDPKNKAAADLLCKIRGSKPQGSD